MKNSILALILLCLFSIQNSFAGPAYPFPVEVKQPDGTKITIINKGDENQNWTETLEGFSVEFDKTTKTWYYVSGYQNGKAILSNIKVNGKVPAGIRKSIRPAKKNVLIRKPTIRGSTGSRTGITSKNHIGPVNFIKGDYRGAILMIMLEFLDKKGVEPASHYADLANQSIDYYKAASFNRAQLTLANETSGTPNDGVIGWLSLNKNHPNTDTPYLFADAIRAADPFIDFSAYDTDGDGHVMSHELAIILVVAGNDKSSQAPGPAIWPHAMFASIDLYTGTQNTEPTADGIKIGSNQWTAYDIGYTGGYCMIAEHQFADEHPTTVGVVVHELGHSLLSLRDLYSNDANSLGGIGFWGLMGSGSWGTSTTDVYRGQTPVMMGAYHRELLNWATPLTGNGQHMLTASASTTANANNSLYKATATNSTDEYFLVENRQNIGYDRGFNAAATYGGLVIWHVNMRATSNNANPPRVDVEVANYANDAKMTGVQASDFWYAGNADTFDATSTPNTNLWSGAASGVAISNISASSTVMSFNVGGGGSTGPTADTGGPYSGNVNSPITFNASASRDPNNLPLTYSWDFGDGSTSSGVTTTHQYQTAGTFTVTLTVNNGQQTASATTNATITDTGGGLTANAGGPYSGTVNQDITFNGSGSRDTNNLPLTYSWNFGDGNSGTGVNPVHRYAAQGQYNITLVVSNGQQTATATATANITAGGGDPVAIITGAPLSGTVGNPVTFDASQSYDPSGRTITYAWDFGDNTPYLYNTVTTTHTYSQAGTYNIRLGVSIDNGANYIITTTTATITGGLTKPTANAGGPYTAQVNQAITFNGSGSRDPNNQALTYSWNFGDGSTGTGVNPSHVYTQAGTYTVRLTVNNGQLNSDVATSTATISSVATVPVPDAGGPYNGNVNVGINLDASGSYDPGGAALTYYWMFGDGATLTTTNPFVSHVYSAAGNYTLWVYVDNGSGSWQGDSTTVSVTAGTSLPVSVAGGPYSGSVGQGIAFNGSQSYDPGGRALTYVWDFGDGSGYVYAAATSHAYAAAGTYTVTLWVTADGQNWANSSTTATVTTASVTPIANPGGPYTARVGSPLFLSGINSYDPSGAGITSYVWRFNDNTPNQQGVYTYHTFYAAGTYNVELWVYNGSAWGYQTTTVYVY